MRGRSAGVWIALVSWLAVPSAAVGQVGGAALAGEVRDRSGTAVPGAAVTVEAGETGRSRTVVTGAGGQYLLQGLAPGVYRVRAEISGFRPLDRNGIRLVTGETIRLDLRLELGGVTEAVTVVADAPLLRSETSSLGQVVDNRKVADLPLNGRSFITLAGLAPGVAMARSVPRRSARSRPPAIHGLSSWP